MIVREGERSWRTRHLRVPATFADAVDHAAGVRCATNPETLDKPICGGGRKGAGQALPVLKEE
jgi:hypothetical protein